MKVTVNEQPQRFYLALMNSVEWKSVVGHEVKVGEYRFCVLPLSKSINVSEVTSGAKCLSIPITQDIMDVTESKEGFMLFCSQIGEHLKTMIETKGDFQERLTEMRATSFALLGEMPPVENFDIEGALKEPSDVLH